MPAIDNYREETFMAKLRKEKTRIPSWVLPLLEMKLGQIYLTSWGRIFHICKWGSEWNLFCEIKGLLGDPSDVWLSKDLVNCTAKQMLRWRLVLNKQKGHLALLLSQEAEDLLPTGKKKKKKKFPLMCGSALGMASAPSYLKVAEYAGDTWSLGKSRPVVPSGVPGEKESR